MEWHRNKLWSGIVRWGSSSGSIVVRRSDNPELDPVIVKMTPLGTSRMMRRDMHYAHHDGMLYVTEPAPTRLERDATEIRVLGRIAQHIDSPHVVDIPADEVEPPSLPRAAALAGTVLVRKVVRDVGDNALLCKLDAWDYGKWREATDTVSRRLADEDYTYGMNRARSSLVAVLPGPWLQPIRRELAAYTPDGEHLPLPFQPQFIERQGQGDVFVYLSNAVDTPVVLPVGAVHLLRSVAVLSAPVRIVALTTLWRVVAGLHVLDMDADETAKPSFDADSFAARRKARRQRRA